MKTLEKQRLISTLGSNLKRVETDMQSVVRLKGVKVKDLQEELIIVAYYLDLLEVDGLEEDIAQGLKRHKAAVEKDFAKYQRKKVLGIKEALDYLKTALIEYKGSLLLKDGIYHTIRKGKVDGEDEVIKVVDGKVVWCDGYFYEEYGEATEDELYRVIDMAEKIHSEVDEDFEEEYRDEEFSTTDEA